MNRVILGVFAVGFCFAVAQALECYKCPVGFWNLCITSKITCNSGEQCYSGVGKAESSPTRHQPDLNIFSGTLRCGGNANYTDYQELFYPAKVIDIKMKGCLPVAKCNTTEDVNFPSSSSNTTVYTMTKTCCNTDLCNAAPGLPGASGLSLALATVAALFMANILV